MKKSLIAFSVMALLVAGFAGASADVYYSDDLANYETGKDSTNKNELEKDNSIDVEVENTANISIKAKNEAETGDNKVKGNLGSTAIATGNATALQLLAAKVNSNDIEVVDGCDCGGDDYRYLGNQNTGKDSYNKNEVELENDIDVEKEETADISLDVENEAETGDNRVEENGAYATWSYWAKAKLSEEWEEPYAHHGGGYFDTWASSEESEETSTPTGGETAIVTGDAEAAQDIAVFANENVIRILRGAFGN